MTSSPTVGPVIIPAGATIAPELAEALAAEIPDAVVGRWPGGPVWLPCGHPSAMTGANRFQLEPGSRPDLAHDLPVELPVGTLVALGTFVATGRPGQVPVPHRCVLALPDTDPAGPTVHPPVHPVEPADDDPFAAGIEALNDLLEFELHHRGSLATVSTALDLAVFVEVLTFFEQVHERRLTTEQSRAEARAWRKLVLSRWPLAAPASLRILAALNVLAAAPPAASDDGWRPVEPANELQALLARMQHDPEVRPRLWSVLYRSTVHLGVAAYDLAPGLHADLSLLGAEVHGIRHVFAFTSADALAQVLDAAGGPMVSVEATGEELARFWPADRWLVLDPGGPAATVLEPAEVRGLPYGPRHGVPRPDSMHVVAPDPDEARDARMAALGAGIDDVSTIRLALLVDRAGGARQPVAAIGVSDEARLARTLSVLVDRAAVAGVASLLAVPDTADNPLAGPLRQHGRLVYRRAVEGEVAR